MEKNQTPKLTFFAVSPKGTKELKLLSASSLATGRLLNEHECSEFFPGYCRFDDLDDMKMCLNWGFDGDPDLYECKVDGTDTAGNSFFVAYVYD